MVMQNNIDYIDFRIPYIDDSHVDLCQHIAGVYCHQGAVSKTTYPLFTPAVIVCLSITI